MGRRALRSGPEAGPGLREADRGVGREGGERGSRPRSGPWVVVGLGNPGPSYAGNRHNAGFMVLDVLAERAGGRFKSHRSRCDVLEGRLSGVRVVLAKPRSFMNESGGPVKALRDFYKVPVERLVVVHDELDIPYGAVRLKRGGGDGGHNGLRSVTRALGDREYLRVRFGVGRPPGRMDAAAFVLRDFSSAERKELDLNVERAADAVEALLTGGLEAAQNVFHAS
ncbi:aminoacyl-tRNA hydrolase [Actinomadura sp. SCN-SB]|uniref:aminoacyl-tRNA hydrolase n=1 Tax=Actinomadura sp. SCN-SB TaxID=3373092 RepID=UPI003752F929